MSFINRLFGFSKKSSDAEENLPQVLHFRFPDRSEKGIPEINETLSRHMFSEIKLDNFKGFLATETKTDMKTNEQTVRYWYGLDECILSCMPAKRGESFRYQMDAMVMDKTNEDCGERWRKAHPDRTMRTMVVMEYEGHYVAIVLHHEKIG